MTVLCMHPDWQAEVSRGPVRPGGRIRPSQTGNIGYFWEQAYDSSKENVLCEDGVVPFEVPKESEQGLQFCTTLNPLSNRHCLLLSCLSCVVSV